jgi:hypothetical protein
VKSLAIPCLASALQIQTILDRQVLGNLQDSISDLHAAFRCRFPQLDNCFCYLRMGSADL